MIGTGQKEEEQKEKRQKAEAEKNASHQKPYAHTHKRTPIEQNLNIIHIKCMNFMLCCVVFYVCVEYRDREIHTSGQLHLN